MVSHINFYTINNNIYEVIEHDYRNVSFLNLKVVCVCVCVCETKITDICIRIDKRGTNSIRMNRPKIARQIQLRRLDDIIFHFANCRLSFSITNQEPIIRFVSFCFVSIRFDSIQLGRYVSELHDPIHLCMRLQFSNLII